MRIQIRAGSSPFLTVDSIRVTKIATAEAAKLRGEIVSNRQRTAPWVSLCLFLGLAAHGAVPERIDPATERVTDAEFLVSPVVSARSWGSTLAPNGRGGFNLATSFWEFGTKKPTENVVVDVQTGECKITEDAPDKFINSFAYTVQTRAKNGRIFFGYGRQCNGLGYYDPATETVKTMGNLLDSSKGDRDWYQRVIGPDDMLYCATHSYQNPTVIRVNPDTLEVKVLGKVGMKDRPIYCYPYNMVVDPPWVYLSIGKKPFELAAINAETGESKVLMTRDDPDNWLGVGEGWAGVRAIYTTGRGQKDKEKHEFYWCADGNLYPCTSPWKDDGKPLPFTPRKVKAPTYPVTGAPELDLSDLNPDSTGTCRIYWRPEGSKGTWNETRFKVKHLSPVEIESLVALPDGTLLGNGKQYHGFFRYDPKTRVNQVFGRYGVSRGPRLVHDGLVYISGYPVSNFSVYDPAKPWTAGKLPEAAKSAGDAARIPAGEAPKTPPVDLNPKFLGNFYAYTATEYSIFLEPGKNGRIYFVGRRERNGVGGGIGYYDLAAKAFGGHHEGLNFLEPRGLVVADALQRVVYSGAVGKDPAATTPPPTEAQLVLYDMDLKEVERVTVKPGLKHTGRICMVKGTEASPQIVGVGPPEKAVYKYDLAGRKLLDWVEINGSVEGVNERAKDGTVWLVLADPETKARYLGFLNPADMSWTKAGRLPGPVSNLAWVGDDLYVTMAAPVGDEEKSGLWRISIPGAGK